MEPSYDGVLARRDGTVRLVFTVPVALNSCTNNISFKPSISGSWHLEEGGKAAVFSPLELWTPGILNICLGTEPSSSLVRESESGFAEQVIFRFREAPSWQSVFLFRLSPGLKDRAGNGSLEEYVFKIRAGGHGPGLRSGVTATARGQRLRGYGGQQSGDRSHEAMVWGQRSWGNGRATTAWGTDVEGKRSWDGDRGTAVERQQSGDSSHEAMIWGQQSWGNGRATTGWGTDVRTESQDTGRGDSSLRPESQATV